MWTISSFTSKILSIFFPPHCYSCNKEGFSLCPLCLEQYQKSIDTPALYITSVYSFHDQRIKKIIHAIKYFHRKDLIPPLSKELACLLQKELSKESLTSGDSQRESPTINDKKLTTSKYVLVPIPMPLLRKYIRGYNQAECIAKELSQQCSLTINITILSRLRSPKRQVTTKTKGERLRNQHNSFKVIGDVNNMHIILVDDVTTTGATIIEARRELLKAGAQEVRAVTLAH